MKSLIRLVKKIEKKERQIIPIVDNKDGGINAECLLLLQCPGQGAIKSGEISRDNYDQTAKYFSKKMKTYKISRENTVILNAIPWAETKFNALNMEKGAKYLYEFLMILRKLKVVVLVGHVAQTMWSNHLEQTPDCRVYLCPQWSTRNIHKNEKYDVIISNVFEQVAKYLKKERE